MKYRIGQKVVYIGPDFTRNRVASALNIVPPVPNAVYTIRGGRVVHCAGYVGAGYVFDEIRNPELRCPCHGGACETHTNEEWLRPLTDISVFERLRKEIEDGGEVDLVRDEVPA